MPYTIEQIARVCHEANRALCEAAGDRSQLPWFTAEAGQRESAIESVAAALADPNRPSSAQHDSWMADKLAHGWTYGLVKSAEAKTHPCLVPYDQLPEHERAKDALFLAVVRALTSKP